MDIENPIALHFIMQDELFFLNEDREAYSSANAAAAETAVITNVADVTDTSESTKTASSAVEVSPILETTPDEFNYRGNKGGLLILVHYPDIEFIHEAHLTALENILKRKGMAVDDAAIVNMAKNSNAGFESLTDYFTPGKILLLGNKALPDGVTPLKLNTPQKVKKSWVLYSFSFDEMMDSPDNKKAFWEQMKGF